MRKQRGVAVLVILALLLTVFTSVIIAKVSVNNSRVDRSRETAAVLQEAYTALLAFAATQNVIGTLPCPDTDGDGLENLSGNSCSNSVGQLPHRELGTGALRDSSGSLLWYAVESSYSVRGGVVARNSSLNNSYQLNGRAVVAVVIAPGEALSGQVRVPVSTTGFLEEENANASVNIYAQSLSDTNNDILLGLDRAVFWQSMEKVVAAEVRQLLQQYANACGQLPWAANFNSDPADSVMSQNAGGLPFDNTLPTNWNSGCAAGVEPRVELADNWRNHIYYHVCNAADGNCLSIVGDAPAVAASVIVTPGIALAGQNRGVAALSDFFEDDNAIASQTFKQLFPRNHGSSFNDSLVLISP